jgi:hypothetical protein
MPPAQAGILLFLNASETRLNWDTIHPATEHSSLLAVDLGVRTGLALFGADGRLRWYRSKNFGNTARLRRGVRAVLAEVTNLDFVILEGGGPIAEIWLAELDYQQIPAQQISADDWRRDFFYPREQRDSATAKQTADTLARRVIEWSDAPRPTSLRHDAAEAILIGLWAALQLGWLIALPPQLNR